jgi:hypothetical protein
VRLLVLVLGTMLAATAGRAAATTITVDTTAAPSPAAA